MRTSLPDPDPATLERSGHLAALLRRRIAAAGGVLPFDTFMQLALYAPGLGYYAAGGSIFGPDGDFVTAPETGTLFARCVARLCADILDQAGEDIVEYGAGSASFAVALLDALAEIGGRPRRFLFVEPSAALAARQRERLAAAPGARGVTLEWYAEHPSARIRGVILANEVLDAMPVKRFVVRDGQAHELGVGCDDAGFRWAECATAGFAAILPPALRLACAHLPDGYVSEFNPALAAWFAGLHAGLERGVVLLSDYGYPAHEYLHPERTDGTLKCHFRHHVHGDPLWHPGAQDITASVDFTAVAEAAGTAGFGLAGYASQTRFLLDCGLHEVLANLPGDAVRQYTLAQEAKRLLLPGEMGQAFKFMALTRNFTRPLRGFQSDERHRLSAFTPADG